MDALQLLVTIADQRVALPATAIESVVEIEAVTPVPRVASHIVGLAALRSRIITVIDCRAALGLAPAPSGAASEAVIVALDGHSYGLLVDTVEDVSTGGAVVPVRGPLAAGWGAVTTGMVEHEGGLALLVDPARMVAGRSVAAT